MAGLIPFNRKSSNQLATGFDGLYNMLDDFFSEPWPLRSSLARDTFKLDIAETENAYVVEAELPGVNKEQINLDFNEGRLTISVNQEKTINEEQKNYLHKERRYSSVSRSIYLADANNDEITAKLENGILNITLPKQEKNQPKRKIDIA